MTDPLSRKDKIICQVVKTATGKKWLIPHEKSVYFTEMLEKAKIGDLLDVEVKPVKMHKNRLNKILFGQVYTLLLTIISKETGTLDKEQLHNFLKEKFLSHTTEEIKGMKFVFYTREYKNLPEQDVALYIYKIIEFFKIDYTGEKAIEDMLESHYDYIHLNKEKKYV